MNQYNMGARDHEDHGNNNNNRGGGGGGGVQAVEEGVSITGGQVIRVMERPSQEQIQLQAAALKCPRCESTNTKFCYYNNYSLSQPRHFCKACKRYWTRGGTLRNVPVGGGCRKNKRFRRPLPPVTPLHLSNHNINSSSNSTSAAAAASAASCSTSTTSVLGAAAGSTSAPLVLHDAMNHHQFMSSLFYGDSLMSHDHHHPQISNFPFARYDDDDSDLHHQQVENLGLGFSSSSSAAAAFSSSNCNAKQQQQILLQDHLVANSNYPSLIGSSNGSSTSSTISSLLMGGGGNGGGGDDQQKQIFGDNIFQSFNFPSSFDHQNMHVCKMENNGQFVAGLGGAGSTGNSHHQLINNVHQHHDHMGGSINDPSSSNSLIWSTTHTPTNWLDPSSNVGSSSVPSLI